MSTLAPDPKSKSHPSRDLTPSSTPSTDASSPRKRRTQDAWTQLLESADLDWFRLVTGVPEAAFISGNEREKYVRPIAPLYHTDFGPHLMVVGPHGEWDAGAFKVWSLNELVEAVEERAQVGGGVDDGTHPASSGACVFEVHIRTGAAGLPYVDVNSLQAHASPGSMFQVASNFNCCEVPSPASPINSGSHVTNLMFDCTQGPAAASGPAVAAITRAHACYYDPDKPAALWGMNETVQVELLGHQHLRRHFPVTNGKVFATKCAPDAAWPRLSDAQKHALLGHTRCGLHTDCPVHFARARTRAGCVVVDEPPCIDQVFVAGLNLRAVGVQVLPREEVASKMMFLLDAAYHTTYAAAALRGSKTLYLTCVGGGVFGNPLDDVATAMAKAHARWVGRTQLTRVVLPLFDVDSDPRVFEKAFRAHNLQCQVVQVPPSNAPKKPPHKY